MDCLLATADCLLAVSAGLPGSIHGGMCLQTDAQTHRRTFTHTCSQRYTQTDRPTLIAQGAAVTYLSQSTPSANHDPGKSVVPSAIVSSRYREKNTEGDETKQRYGRGAESREQTVPTRRYQGRIKGSARVWAPFFVHTFSTNKSDHLPPPYWLLESSF